MYILSIFFQTEYIFMFEKLYSIFSSNRFNNRLLQILIVLACIFIIYSLYNRYYVIKLEGFQQSDKYILRENENIYHR